MEALFPGFDAAGVFPRDHAGWHRAG
jgi:hypothetical protein